MFIRKRLAISPLSSQEYKICIELDEKRFWDKFFKLILISLSLSFCSNALAGYSLIVQKSTRTTSFVDGQSANINQGQDSISSASQGTESSQCQAYGRSSSSSALAKAIETLRKSDAVGISLSAVVAASGGHYRTCTTCVLNQCVGIEGHDTKSSAQAESNASILLKFDDQTLPGQYNVTLIENKKGPDEHIKVSVKDSAGNVIQEKIHGIYEVHGSPNATYQISAAVDADSNNAGGCCSDTHSNELTLNVLVERLGQMELGNIPFILGGKFTNEYRQVGLITLQKKDGTVVPHCTGTLVGKKTVLTAAHCVADDYENAASENRLKFILGASIDDADAERFAITKAVYPKSGGFQYKLVKTAKGEESTIDDIALVYLDNASTKQPMSLYKGTSPAVQDLITSSEPLAFVGFGLYTISSDGKKGDGSGKKRIAFVPLVSQDKRTFYYKVNQNGQGVCRGDSGGPTLIETPQNPWRVLGITAFGSGNCQDGHSMKVDAFFNWINPLIQN